VCICGVCGVCVCVCVVCVWCVCVCVCVGTSLCSSTKCSNSTWEESGIVKVVECKRTVMAHAQKPDSVFQRNGRVHLYRRECQFSRVLAFLECGSGENDCSNTGWTVLSQNEACFATHSIRLFPLHFSSRASPCATRFRFHSTSFPNRERRKRSFDPQKSTCAFTPHF